VELSKQYINKISHCIWPVPIELAHLILVCIGFNTSL